MSRIDTDKAFQSTRPCGARLQLRRQQKPNFMFQSTRPCGARPYTNNVGNGLQRFQSTRPCGARHADSDNPVADLGFNPRAPAGRDT